MESIARRLVIPLIKEKCESMNMRDRVLVTSKIVGLPRNRRYDSAIEHMLQFMPTLAAEVEVNAISGMDPTRRDSHNDFFERERLIYAMAHSGPFAAIDKWLTILAGSYRLGGILPISWLASSLAVFESRITA